MMDIFSASTPSHVAEQEANRNVLFMGAAQCTISALLLSVTDRSTFILYIVTFPGPSLPGTVDLRLEVLWRK